MSPSEFFRQRSCFQRHSIFFVSTKFVNLVSLHFHIDLEALFLCLGLKQGKAVNRNKCLFF